MAILPRTAPSRRRSGEAHDKKGEAVLGHVDGAEFTARSSYLLDFARFLKNKETELVATIKIVDGHQHIIVPLPKHLRNMPAVGQNTNMP